MREMTSTPRWVSLAWILALPLLAIACYGVGVNGGFVFDDFPNIVDNVALRVDDLRWSSWTAAMFSSESGSLQRPISMATFALNWYFTGGDAAAMKWTNIAIHSLNGVLVFGLVRTILRLSSPAIPAARKNAIAWGCAALWLIHPINFTSVLYVVQRMESLAHTFVFAGLWLYLHGRLLSLEDRKGHWQIGVGLIAGTGLAALCKESGVLLPLYAWVAEMCLPALRGSRGRREIQGLFGAILWLPAFFGLLWLWPRVSAPGAWASRDYTLVERLMTEGRVLIDYARWSVVPSLRELTLYHDDYVASRSLLSPVSTTLSWIACILLVSLGWWLRNRRPLAALGILWFFAAQALTASIIPLDLVYEHRNYFASLGVCLALADAWMWVADRFGARKAMAFPVIFLLGFGMTTHLRAREWSTPLRMTYTEAEKRPQSPRAVYGYARQLVIATDYKTDSPFLKPATEALDRARALPDSGILPHSAQLLLLAHTNQSVPSDVWDDMYSRLRRDPIGPQEINSIRSITQCGARGECNFPNERMLAMYDAALERGAIADIVTMKGEFVLNRMGNADLALRLWKEAVELSPETAQYRVNLIKMLIHVRRFDEARSAIEDLRTMGKLGQNDAAADALDTRLRDAGGDR